jgi:small multidrug resistance family-3 protein
LHQGKPWWWAVCGSAVLMGYGFVPCAQPMSDFGRIYAVYGGFFIVLSYLWGKAESPRARGRMIQ